jgi:DNA-directed RNA polymerase subunit RPC12/RpoP
MGTCKKCGKTVTKRELSKNYGRCQDCFRKECDEYEYWKAKQLSSPDIINRETNTGKKCKECFFSKTEHQILSDTEICLKFQTNITMRQELAETCSRYVAEADYEKKGVNREINKEEEFVQMIIDFSTLKDVMAKSGILMTSYECPNCKGTVKIPEAGNIIICQYCRTPIRPMEIFKKIKFLMQ